MKYIELFKEKWKTSYLYRRKVFYLILFLFILIISCVICLSIKYSFYPSCKIHDIFGVHCASCGSTRMIISILNGDLYQAFRYNPYIFILLLCTPLILVYLYNVFVKQKHSVEQFMKYLYLFLISAIIFMVLRNIPLFKYFAPTKI